MIWLVTFLLLSISSGSSLDAPNVIIPNQGVLTGTYLRMYRTQNIKAYLGIQYAEANRFSAPQIQVSKWNSLYNATSFAPDCWQKISNNMDDETRTVTRLLSGNNYMEKTMRTFDENCLYLNVFVPNGYSASNGYAVIVWIPAGDFSYGSSMDIDPFQLVFKQRVIVVTISYRVGIFGFLSTGDGELQGNYGLMDQSAALFWVRKNINYFGGNENQITIMGHSAGAVSIGLHMASKEWSNNAFTKAIIMSENILGENKIKRPDEYGKILDTLATTFGCSRKPTSKLIQCLKRVSAKVLVDNIPFIDWGPVIDYGLSNTSYPFVEDYPKKLFERGTYKTVPSLMGVTDMEDALKGFENMATEEKSDVDINSLLSEIALNDVKDAISDNSSSFCTNYDIVVEALNLMYQNHYMMGPNVHKNFDKFETDRLYTAPLYSLAKIFSEREKTFVYIFNIKPTTNFHKLPDWVSVPKYFDQIFVWGAPYTTNDIVKYWDPKDKRTTDIIMSLWANFAKTSDPSTPNVVWTPFNKLNRSIFVINENFSQKHEEQLHIENFWNVYYPSVINHFAECCNNTIFGNTNSLHIKQGLLSVILCFIVILVQS